MKNEMRSEKAYLELCCSQKKIGFRTVFLSIFMQQKQTDLTSIGRAPERASVCDLLGPRTHNYNYMNIIVNNLFGLT